VGHTAGLDILEKRRLPNPWRDSNPRIVHPVAYILTELNQLQLIDFILSEILKRSLNNFEMRHPRCVGSITQNFCVLHVQSNTKIFNLAVQ